MVATTMEDPKLSGFQIEQTIEGFRCSFSCYPSSFRDRLLFGVFTGVSIALFVPALFIVPTSQTLLEQGRSIWPAIMWSIPLLPVFGGAMALFLFSTTRWWSTYRVASLHCTAHQLTVALKRPLLPRVTNTFNLPDIETCHFNKAQSRNLLIHTHHGETHRIPAHGAGRSHMRGVAKWISEAIQSSKGTGNRGAKPDVPEELARLLGRIHA